MLNGKKIPCFAVIKKNRDLELGYINDQLFNASNHYLAPLAIFIVIAQEISNSELRYILSLIHI